MSANRTTVRTKFDYDIVNGWLTVYAQDLLVKVHIDLTAAIELRRRLNGFIELTEAEKKRREANTKRIAKETQGCLCSYPDCDEPVHDRGGRTRVEQEEDSERRSQLRQQHRRRQ